jgi:hypothetical protein
MLKFSNIIFSKSKNIVKDNSEYLGIFHLLKWIFQNELIIWWTCVEMAKLLRYQQERNKWRKDLKKNSFEQMVNAKF